MLLRSQFFSSGHCHRWCLEEKTDLDLIWSSTIPPTSSRRKNSISTESSKRFTHQSFGWRPRRQQTFFSLQKNSWSRNIATILLQSIFNFSIRCIMFGIPLNVFFLLCTLIALGTGYRICRLPLSPRASCQTCQRNSHGVTESGARSNRSKATRGTNGTAWRTTPYRSLRSHSSCLRRWYSCHRSCFSHSFIEFWRRSTMRNMKATSFSARFHAGVDASSPLPFSSLHIFSPEGNVPDRYKFHSRDEIAIAHQLWHAITQYFTKAFSTDTFPVISSNTFMKGKKKLEREKEADVEGSRNL